VTQRAIKKIGDDELSTRGAALSYYFVLALFPMLLFVVSVIGIFAGANSELRESIFAALSHLAPGSASDLMQNVVGQTAQSSSALKIGAGILGALWAASAGVSAVVVSLNVLYRYTETRRPWWKQKLTVLGLTVSLAALIICAVVLVLYGGKIGYTLVSHFGFGHLFTVTWSVMQWPFLFAAMFLSFALVYYFGPNAPKSSWHWLTPGVALGVTLWLAASAGFRVYLHFF
jgi:membrane protein